MRPSPLQAFFQNFLGSAPTWYKLTIISFLILNPFLMFGVDPFVAGWALIAEFIFTLAMALKCYPLPAGGLLALEAVALKMTSPETVYHEALKNFEVILLLIFMVAGIYFMKEFLQFTFTRILVRVRSKMLISLLFCFAGAFLSAFLDALTVTAVIMAVAFGFYNVYHRFASGKTLQGPHDLVDDSPVKDKGREDLREFRAFLRNLMMHGAVGTALGGVCTLVGEPQNLLIGGEMGWHFVPFFLEVMPVSMPVFFTGMLTCVAVEAFHLFGYGAQMPGNIRSHLLETAIQMEEKQGQSGKIRLVVQALTGIWLVLALGFHLAAVGIIGLSVIILLTAMNGIVEEHRLGKAFEEALPFTALLVVFFSVVAVIHDQGLFHPIIEYVLHLKGQSQLVAYYCANGLLSAISDNVFVATVYISETKLHFVNVLGAIPDIGMTGQALMDKLTDPHVARADVLATLPQAAAARAQEVMLNLDKLAVAINTGTNIPSVATPNGQAAFLFLLTSALAPVIRLSYGRMVMLALPYTITMSLVGLAAVNYLL
ncbi:MULTISPECIES: sodium/proton antiporter NhaB [unclassified Pseudodesulfovibrio]|uniref:sodium/proton antiporter NhaB n=1 Tax=unclassified Pseudodesulfovibrio TaxID=2661612 RepID=UPI000FEBB00B|nr:MULTISPECIES: sodium/proton antiporter NhaB [unclassified Pseudodesulfovibrio]MCJ2163511.1 sodium/proton antiporter NhaB [Pseudodesulfovibrio sp. S3-i]RWU06747.1 sodium/proton antiporter NhaB [Pseudodesulfovibrio sp. S3]